MSPQDIADALVGNQARGPEKPGRPGHVTVPSVAYNFRRGVCLRLLMLVFRLTVVRAAQSSEAIELASIKLGDQHSSSTSFRFLPGGGVHVGLQRELGATLANMVLFPYDLRESSLECEFLL
jgi:hypothetical protein